MQSAADLEKHRRVLRFSQGRVHHQWNSDISQNMTVAELLSNGASYPVISKDTGASTAAINRVGKCCEYGSGGCKTVIDR